MKSGWKIKRNITKTKTKKTVTTKLIFFKVYNNNSAAFEMLLESLAENDDT